ncbi:U4/U6.U5 tri-snRNP-associated protein 2-like [Mytilus californianus]|uniref:U4/U6.U5 tri-snRNP-associated protein 2-like n=1 Tax=Mytilus californianus TaxID=6549 RepID=UPI0022451E48|nr:U4/U6.U5 tri-snRNP-associated protein 2-like [Mytilus californianus]
MAANDTNTKQKGSTRAILKRAHVSETVQEDDDNPIKSILKKSKKPKLDSSVEEHSKAQQEPTQKLGSRIASQVTVVSDQKLTDSTSKVEKSPSQQRNKPILDNRQQSDVNQPNRNEDTSDVAKSGISPDKGVGSEKSRKEVKKEISASEKSGKYDKKGEKKDKEKVKKGKGTESKSSVDKKQSPIKSTSKKTTVKVEEEDEEIAAVQDPKVDRSRICPYLDTINRSVLDFDFEKLCSVSLSHINVYACLVCGKYFQGRGKMSHAYTHSVLESHHVYLNLQTQKFYCLPDNYQIIDSSLEDIIYVLNPTFTPEQIQQMDNNSKLSIAYDKTTYLPGIVGLNNIKANDYCNVVLQALSHVTPLRNYFLQESNYSVIKRPPGDQMCLLTQRFGELLRKLWNPRNFKAHVSPHEMLQAVVLCSKKKLQITEQGDAIDFLSWFLNAGHGALNGTRKLSSSIINKTFRGTMKVYTRKVLPVELSDEEKAKLMEQEEYKVRMDEMPWLYLTCDLPPPPLYPDEMRENIIPQIPFSVLLSKFNGINEKEYKTYKDSTMKRFEITQLPPYIIIYIKRFAKNYFITEKNPTIVNFPIKNVDFGDLLAPEIRAKHKCTTYDLMANIVHDGEPGPGKGTYRVHVLHKGTGKWYEMQDLHVIDILPQMIPLSESYIQIFELRRDIPNPTYGKSTEENVTMES